MQSSACGSVTSQKPNGSRQNVTRSPSPVLKKPRHWETNTCKRTCLHTHLHTQTCTCAHTCILYKHAHTRTCIHTCTCTHTRTCLRARGCTHVCRHIHTRAHSHNKTCTLTHAHTCAYLHAHMRLGPPLQYKRPGAALRTGSPQSPWLLPAPTYVTLGLLTCLQSQHGGAAGGSGSTGRRSLGGGGRTRCVWWQ